MELTQDEKKLIEHLRTMDFKEVIEVATTIDEKNARMSRLSIGTPFHKEAVGVFVRLNTFTDLLCQSSEAYKKEVALIEQD